MPMGVAQENKKRERGLNDSAAVGGKGGLPCTQPTQAQSPSTAKVIPEYRARMTPEYFEKKSEFEGCRSRALDLHGLCPGLLRAPGLGAWVQ